MAWVLSPAGVAGSIPDDQLQAALKKGYTLREPTPKELAGEQTGQAAVEGVLEGASLGFATPLVRNVEATLSGKTNEQVAEEMRLRKQENPNVNLATQFAGAAGVGLLTGGVSGLVGGGVKGLAVEGGLAGLGSVIDESVLENRDITAEKLAMGGASGALMGAGLGVAFKGVGNAVSAVVKKTGASALGAKLGGLADEAERRALLQGASPEEIARTAPYMDNILAYGRNRGLIGKVTSAFDAESLGKLEQELAKSGKKIGDQVERLQQVNPLTDDSRDVVLRRIETVLRKEYGANPAYDTQLRGVLAKIDDLRGSGPPPSVAEVMAGASPGVAPKGNVPKTWGDMWRWQSDLYNELGAASPNVGKELASGVRRVIRESAMEAAEMANPGQRAAMEAASREYAAGTSFKDMFERNVYNVDKMRSVGQRGIEGAFYGSLYGGDPLGGAARGVARGVGEHFLARRGGLFMGSALRSLSEGNLLNGTAANLMKRISTGATDLIVPGSRVLLEQAAARGTEDLLAEHFRLANGPQGPEYMASLGMSPETSEELSATSEKLAAYHAIQSETALVDATMDSAVDGLVGAKPGRSSGVNLGKLPDYEKTSALLKDMLRDPSKAFEQVDPKLLAMAPHTVGMTVQAMLRGAQYLDEKAPKDPNGAMPEFLKTPWKPSKAELETWQRSIDAVQQPLKVLEMMGKGVLTQEHVDAMQAVYPKMYDELKNRIFERLSVWDKQVPYKKRLALAQIFGPQALGMSVDQQKVLQMSQESMVQSKQGGSKGPDGRQEINAEKNQMTQAQRLEQRG
jgi:hypothetical protein